MSRFAPIKSPVNSIKSPNTDNIKAKSNSINSVNSVNRNSINRNNSIKNTPKDILQQDDIISSTLFAPTQSTSLKEKDLTNIDNTISLPTSNKRKSFVTIVKPSETFGEPPPLHKPILSSPDKVVIHNEQDVLSVLNASKLQKQSVRWLNLSATFWYLIVMDTERSVTKDNLNSFFEVIKWRAHDKINEDEFSVLYSEWIGKSTGSNRRGVVGIFTVRQMLLENSCTESDLDLYIGMIMNEANKYTLHIPINYISKLDSAHNQPHLELVSSKWLSLSEELFFCLDSPGYGVLRFDEIFFLSSCLAIGLQGWQNENDVETIFNNSVLSAVTLQLMRDMGANINLTSLRQELLSLGGHSELEVTLAGSENVVVDGIVNKPIRNGSSPLKQPMSGYKKQSITMRMFKQYFLRKSVNESTLAALLLHVKMCIERLARITSSNSAQLYSASKPLENQRAIGSPRLWQQAVLTALGYSPELFDKNRATQFPPILLFLLSDADKLISGALRAYENPIDNINSSLQNTGSQSFRRVRLSTYEEMHETCHRLWNAFRHWGVNKTKGAYAGLSSSEFISEKHSDPIYQLIVSALVEYKNLQLQLCAALYDLTMTHYGLQTSSNPISVVCASLLPNAESMIVELGLDESPEFFDQQIDSLISSSDIQVSPESAATLNTDIISRPEITTKSSSPISNEKPTVAFKSLYLDFDSNKSAIKEESTRESLSKDPRSKPEGRADLVRKAQWERVFDARNEEKYPSPIDNSITENKLDNFVPQFEEKSILNSNEVQGTGDSSVFKFEQQEALILQQLLSTSNPDEQKVYIDRLRERLGLDNTNDKNTYFQSNNNDVKPETNNTDGMNNESAENYYNVSKNDSPTNNNSESKAYDNFSRYSIPYAEKLQNDNFYSIDTDEIFENKYVEHYNEYDGVRTDSPLSYSNKSEASVSTNGPSSIADLLESGQSAGKYAQGLREILRKMAKDDSKVQVQSLEQVIKLGQEIIVKESYNGSSQGRRSTMATDGSPSNSTPMGTTHSKLSQRRNTTSSNMMIEATAIRRANANNNYITPAKDNGGLIRTNKSKVPGVLPQTDNKDKKAFGHRL